MFNEVNEIKNRNNEFELPRSLDDSSYSKFELPRSLFKEAQIEKKENPIEVSKKIIDEVNHDIAESLIDKSKEGKHLQFKDIQDVLVKPTLKETIIAVSSAASIFMVLGKINPELINESNRKLKKDIIRFYKNNLKEISEIDNSENIKKIAEGLGTSIERLKTKAKDLADVTMNIAIDSVYVAGKLMLDTGAAIESGIITGLEKTAEFANQPGLTAKVADIGVFKELSDEYSKEFEHSKQVDKVVKKIKELPFAVAELYLTVYATEIYLNIKVVLGAGQVIEHAGKFVIEVGAKALGKDEFASKVQDSHVIDDISESVDGYLGDTISQIDKISSSVDVSDAIEGIEIAGNVGETIGEIGSEIAICIAATATGNIPLAVGMIALSACDAGGQAIDVAVEKTGKFTWKETLVGVGTAAVDAASLGLSRGFTKAALKTTETGARGSKIGKIGQKIPGKFGKVLEGSVIAGVDSGIFQLSDVANPILEKQLDIDKNVEINWKKIGISTGIGFATGGLFAYIGEVVKANKIKKTEKTIKKEIVSLNSTISDINVKPLSSYEDRINRVPKREYFNGQRGESLCIFKKIKGIPEGMTKEQVEGWNQGCEQLEKILKKYGLSGIEYRNGIPDFSPVSECSTKIEHMTANRPDNFNKCDVNCASEWNKTGKFGKSDWTKRTVKEWRKSNNFVWHERNDMITCDLVPFEINDSFKHLGGVSECKIRDANKVVKFDV